MFARGELTPLKSPSMTVVTFETGPYTYRGTAFTATAVVTGAGRLDQSVPVVYGGDCTNVTVANGCWATATFAGDATHFGSTDTKYITITKAASTVTVTCPASVVYNGLAQTPCTAKASGVGMSDVDVTASLVYGNNTNVGMATADASWAGDANHTATLAQAVSRSPRPMRSARSRPTM